MQRPLTKTILDRMGCSNPYCDHKEDHKLDLIQLCHPIAGLVATYDGTLELTCAECGQSVASVKVADI